MKVGKEQMNEHPFLNKLFFLNCTRFFFIRGGQRIDYFAPERGNKMHFMTRY